MNKKKKAITDQDIADLKKAWTAYKQDRKTYRLSRLNLGRELYRLQTERAKPKTGNFVEFIHEQVGIPTSTAYDLIKYFKRINNVVEVTERIARAAFDAEVDLTEAKMKPALQKYASQLKKAESLPEVRAVIEQMATFKPPEHRTKPQFKKDILAMDEGRAIAAAQHYFSQVGKKELLAKWESFVQIVKQKIGLREDDNKPVHAANLIAPEKAVA